MKKYFLKAFMVFFTSIVGFFSCPMWAIEPFVVKKIQLEGLQRISEGTVYNYLPFKEGDHLDSEHSAGIIRALFKTGFFEDVHLARTGDTLIIQFKERPAIAKVTVQGNKSIKQEELLSSLKEIGLAQGRTYDPSLLERIQRDLERQFLGVGKYALKVQSTVTSLERNRVDIHITIEEGETARIREINFIGNKDFTSRKLKSLMRLSTPWLFSWFTKDDQYSRSKLVADQEAIREFYLNRGYLKMRLDSTQVTLSDDKSAIYLTFNITEGDRYTVSGTNLTGNWIVPLSEVESLVLIEPGSYFSRSQITDIIKALQQRLGKEGYAFANIDVTPEIDDAKKTVHLSFYCTPGRRMYARRILMNGNHLTKDTVLRREMVQLEAAPLSTAAIEESRNRLNRTGFFSKVEIEPKTLPDKVDEVDVAVDVVETHAGQVSGGVGYSTDDGILFNASISNRNFFGTGNSAGFSFNNSKAYTTYNITYNDPYYTIDGVSRGFNLFYSTVDLSKTSSISNYTTDLTGGSVHYSFPLTAWSRLNVGYGYQGTVLKIRDLQTASIQVQHYMNGRSRLTSEEITAFIGWSYNNLDRYIFPERGQQAAFDINGAVFGNVHHYGLSAKHQWFYPLIGGFIFNNTLHVAYGDGYGNTHGLPKGLPFYKHYYTGGSRSVRGFQENVLGPKDSLTRPFGGNLLFTDNIELALPSFFSDDTSSTRTSLFVDAGQVWDTRPLAGLTGSNGLRFTAGISLTWMSPMGPLVFSVAKPLKSYASSFDKEQVLSFGFGTNF